MFEKLQFKIVPSVGVFPVSRAPLSELVATPGSGPRRRRRRRRRRREAVERLLIACYRSGRS